MAFSGSRLAIILLLHATLFILSVPVSTDDDDDHLLQGINSFRQSSSVPVLTEHDKAECIAEEIADKLEDENRTSNTMLATQSQIMTNYARVFQKCKVGANTTRDGMILPVYVPHRVSTLVLTNYAESQNSRYLNNSWSTGVGIRTEDDWTVLVLTTALPVGALQVELGEL